MKEVLLCSTFLSRPVLQPEAADATTLIRTDDGQTGANSAMFIPFDRRDVPFLNRAVLRPLFFYSHHYNDFNVLSRTPLTGSLKTGNGGANLPDF